MEWQRLKQAGLNSRGTLQAGLAAFDVSLKKRHLDEAGELAGNTLEIARFLVERNSPDEVVTLRDLSVSLNNVGRTHQALGEWELAQRCFEEGLMIGEMLGQTLPKLPEYNSLAGYFREHLDELSDRIS